MSEDKPTRARRKRTKKEVKTEHEPEEPETFKVPLEDKPRSMQDNGESKTAFDIPEPQEKEEVKPEAVKKSKIVFKEPPTHFGCGGVVGAFAETVRGYWWECVKCGSQFHAESRKKTGEIGNPEDAKVSYKVDGRSKRRFRH